MIGPLSVAAVLPRTVRVFRTSRILRTCCWKGGVIAYVHYSSVASQPNDKCRTDGPRFKSLLAYITTDGGHPPQNRTTTKTSGLHTRVYDEPPWLDEAQGDDKRACYVDEQHLKTTNVNKTAGGTCLSACHDRRTTAVTHPGLTK